MQWATRRAHHTRCIHKHRRVVNERMVTGGVSRRGTVGWQQTEVTSGAVVSAAPLHQMPTTAIGIDMSTTLRARVCIWDAFPTAPRCGADRPRGSEAPEIPAVVRGSGLIKSNEATTVATNSSPHPPFTPLPPCPPPQLLQGHQSMSVSDEMLWGQRRSD